MCHSLLLLGVLAVAQADDAAKAKPPAIKRADGVADALAAALRDGVSVPIELRELLKVVRYVWCPSGTKEEVAAVISVVNHALSKSTVPVRPKVIRVGTSVVLRWNFFRLGASDRKKIQALLDVWEKQAADEPFFLGARFFAAFKSRGHAADPYWFGLLKGLQKLTGSEVPIVRADWFIYRATSTIDLGLGDGLYYEFVGIDGLKFDDVLKLAGVDVADAERTNTDLAALMAKSLITAKNRKIRFLPAKSTAKNRGFGMAVWTEDPTDTQVADENDPFRNVLNHKFAAIELFIELPNGLIATALYDGAGNQQDSAPDDVVSDKYAGLTSLGGTRRLQGGIISCGRCHVRESKSFFQVAKNDLRTLLKRGGADIVDDLTRGKGLSKLDRAATLERIVSLYDFDPEDRVLPAARRAYAHVVTKLVGDVWILDAVEKSWAEIVRLYHGYVYERVTPQKALAELGYAVADKDAAAKIFAAHFRFAPGFEADPKVALLRAGVPICRADFDRIFPLLAGSDLYRLGAAAGGSIVGLALTPTAKATGAEQGIAALVAEIKAWQLSPRGRAAAKRPRRPSLPAAPRTTTLSYDDSRHDPANPVTHVTLRVPTRNWSVRFGAARAVPVNGYREFQFSGRNLRKGVQYSTRITVDYAGAASQLRRWSRTVILVGGQSHFFSVE